jgi:predicted transcriptional regulator
LRKSKLDTPHIKEKVVKQLAVGESQNRIAKEVDLNQSQISRFASRDDVRELIEQEQARLVECVPDAVENVKDLVKEMKDIPKKDTKRRELSYKASKDVLKSVGLLPTPVQSQTFINLYQDNRTELSPLVRELLDAKFAEITADVST